MKFTGKFIGVQQPSNKQTRRADITAKFHNVASHAASQHLFQFSQQDAEFFGINLLGNDGIFGEELVGDHYEL